MPQAYHHALPAGARIENYEIQSVLGVGGFGITYKGYDHSLRCDVAIKEYLPNELALRTHDGTTVIPKSDKDEKSYQYGLKQFLEEARTLAMFREPNIVRVTRFLECNGTAYLVMDYEDGQSLADYLKRHPTLTETQIKAVIMPLLRSLEVVHAKDYLHRDIKPANIYLRKAGSPVLLDFGAARMALGGQTRTMTGMVTPGYAPFEQYHTRVRQGPWTDLYAIGATMYRCSTGKVPVDATERVAALHEGDKDPLQPAIKWGKGKYSLEFLKTIDWMLRPNAKERPQHIQDVLKLLSVATDSSPQPPQDEDIAKTIVVNSAADGSATGHATEEPSTTDEVKAAGLTLRVAKQGDKSAQLTMSALYARGRGVTKDTQRAAKWCRKAADQGDAKAQFKLAMLYAHGYGEKQDVVQALKWCRLSAEQGHAGAQFNLGLMYAYERGVEQDEAIARVWYERAAKQGHVAAQRNLTLMGSPAGALPARKRIIFLVIAGVTIFAVAWLVF
ncbi:MAG: hypothetical protein BMS9Abin36_1237 [Gammaproteobacteria bacterium]|nr:MAG: hypothetical protein BMS9Abin36_1237 [Gammaproteobacteria bacterium]